MSPLYGASKTRLASTHTRCRFAIFVDSFSLLLLLMTVFADEPKYLLLNILLAADVKTRERYNGSFGSEARSVNSYRMFASSVTKEPKN